jgi:NADH dehydrogenase
LRQLLAEGHEVRCLLRPSKQTRHLPNEAVHITTGALQDLPALQTAVQGVDAIIHLAGARQKQGRHSAEWINHYGTANLIQAAQHAGVGHIVYLSHMHADRNSAYPLLRGKGAAEEAIRASSLTHTILRSSLIFGPHDSFTTLLAMLIKIIPFVFPVTGAGKTRFQPIHVEDVARCLTDCLDNYHLKNTALPIGGPQHLSYSEILDAVMETLRVNRVRLHLRLPVIRTLVRLSGLLFLQPPVSGEQIDLFSIDNTTDLGNVPRNFYFEARRFTEHLGYLRRKGWRRAFLRTVYQRKRE